MKYLIGMISGMTATVVVQPFDIIKVYMQLNPQVARKQVVREIYNRAPRGLLNFYSGLSIALLRQSVYGTLRLGMFQDLKDNYKWHPMLAATGAAVSIHTPPHPNSTHPYSSSNLYYVVSFP